MTLLERLCDPDIDPMALSLAEKMHLVKASDGLLVDLLEGCDLSGLNLWLENCESLTHLPEGLTTNILSLTGCSVLEKLPERLEVRVWLDLKGCVSLPYKKRRDLPKGVKVKGQVFWR